MSIAPIVEFVIIAREFALASQAPGEMHAKRLQMLEDIHLKQLGIQIHFS